MKIPQDMAVGTVHQTNFNGTIEILSYKNKNHIVIRFNDTGNVKTVSSRLIRLKSIKDELKADILGVGFFGIGEYKSKNPLTKKHTPQYSTWRSMLRRCYYAPYIEKNPTYKGCSVHPEWHNFQNFAKWYDENHPNDGNDYQLDKDIKVEGNKLYSPITCSFVTKRENTQKAKAKSYTFISPDNVVTEIYNLSEFCRENNLNVGSMCSVGKGSRNHHKGWRLAK